MTTIAQLARERTAELRYQQEEDEYGLINSVGIPPESHSVTDLLDMDEDIDVQLRVASTLRRMGAPPQASDHMYGWEGTELDEAGWLWIKFRTGAFKPVPLENLG